MSNSRGSYRSTRENSMRAFDKLPRSVREALTNANLDYATQPVLTSWRRGSSAKALVKLIRQWDRDRRRART